MLKRRTKTYVCGTDKNPGCGHQWQQASFCNCPKRCPKCGRRTRPEKQ